MPPHRGATQLPQGRGHLPTPQPSHMLHGAAQGTETAHAYAGGGGYLRLSMRLVFNEATLRANIYHTEATNDGM